MASSGIVWDDANLDGYIANPRKFMPKNRMSYGGMKDEAKRKAITAYLKSLK